MGDLISRQAAIDALINDPIGKMIAEKYNLVGWLEGLPSAQPEQKTGKWIYHEPVDVFECSVCGRQMVRNIFDYCPWCGTKMEVGK